MLRIVLVPFFVWFLIADAPGLHSESGPWRWAAVAAFAVAIYTDKLDGDIARSRGLVTDFGKIADPIADKLLIGSALVMLSVLNELPWWITIGHPGPRVGHHRAAVLRHPLRRDPRLARRQAQDRGADGRHLPLPPSAGLHCTWLGWVAFAVMMVAVLITVWTGVEYVLEALQAPGPGAAARPRNGRTRTSGHTGMTMHRNLHRIAGQAVAGAIARGVTVATAESLTAGMVTAVLADTPGASGHAAGRRGFLPELRQGRRPGRSAANCSTPSAPWTVTWPPPWRTAPGALCGADIGVSTTGVAGPERARRQSRWVLSSSASPRRRGHVVSRTRFEGSRAEIRALACAARPWSGCWKPWLPEATGRKVAGNKSRLPNSCYIVSLPNEGGA